MTTKYDTPKLQRIAEFLVNKWWKKAEDKFGLKIGAMPAVKMNARLTSTAGRAFIEHGYIDLSCYLMTNNPETFAEDTIPHELAHMIAFRLYQDRGHGKAWKYVAQTLYGANNRCHTMQTKRRAEGA
jgi:SprT protein